MATELAVASRGAFGLSPQQYSKAGGTSIGQSLPGSPTWHWFSATQVGFGVAQMMGGLPPAIARGLISRGLYKSGFAAGGGIELVPSLQNDFGFLLHALSGIFGYGVIADSQLAATHGAYPNVTGSATGCHVHTWVPDADDSRLGYSNARKLLPGVNKAASLGEVVSDVRVSGAVFNIPNSGILSATIGFAGITPSLANAPSWAPVYDDEKFGVVSSTDSFVSFEINGSFVAAPCVGAQITMDNGLNTQLRRIGSPYLFGMPSLSRATAIRATVAIDTTSGAGWELYTWILANAAKSSATAPSLTPYQADVHLRVASPFTVITGAPYAFEFLSIAGNCAFGLADQVPLRAGGTVFLTLDIVPQATVGVSDYATEVVATGGSSTTVVKAAAGWTPNQYIGYTAIVESATTDIVGEARTVLSNDATTLTFDSDDPFSATITAADVVQLYPPAWMLRLQNGTASYSWPTTT